MAEELFAPEILAFIDTPHDSNAEKAINTVCDIPTKPSMVGVVKINFLFAFPTTVVAR